MTAVLIHPTGVSDESPAATEHWRRTVASPFDFRADPAFLTTEQRSALDELHVDGRAHFWGAHGGHRGLIRRIKTGDVAVLTGNRRVLAVGRVGAVITSRPLGDAMWPNRHPTHGSYAYLYSLTALTMTDLPLAGLRDAGIRWFQTPSYIDDERTDAILKAFRSVIPASTAAAVASTRHEAAVTVRPSESGGARSVNGGSEGVRGTEPVSSETETTRPAPGLATADGLAPLSLLEEAFLSRLESIESTDAAGAVRVVRREQSLLRDALGLGRGAGTNLVQCGLCHRPLPRGLLVAAHVKPRSECSELERRDIPHVAMAACVLGCEALYEAGYLTVDQSGRIVTARARMRAPHLQAVLRGFERQKAPAWTPLREPYFAWHREHRFVSERRAG